MPLCVISRKCVQPSQAPRFCIRARALPAVVSHGPSTCIRPASPSDAPYIAEIYAHYVLNTLVTFEVAPPSATEIATRMAQSIMWLICETVQDHEVVGYAYARPYRPERPAYDVAVETSVYLRHDDRWLRKGIGRELVTALTVGLRAIRLEGTPEMQRYHQALAIQSRPHTTDEREDYAVGGFYRVLGFRHVDATQGRIQ